MSLNHHTVQVFRDSTLIERALNAHAIIAVTDARGYVKEVNEKFCELSGYRPDELIGRTLNIVRSDYHSDEFWKEMWETLLCGGIWHGEVCNRSKSGLLYWVSATITPKMDNAGRLEECFTIQTDITAQKRAEEDVYRTTELLEVTNRVARIGAWEFYVESQSLVWSSVTKEIHEVSADFVPSVDTAVNFYREGRSREKIRTLFEDAVTKGQDYDVNLEIVTAKGKTLWVRAIGHSEVRDGQCVKIFGTFQDIDEHVRFQRELSRISDLLRNTMAAATEISFIATDRDGLIELFNQGSENMLGYKAVEMVGKHSPALIHVPEEVDSRAAELSEELGRAISGFDTFVAIPRREGSEQREWTYVRKDGSTFPVSLIVTPVRNSSGELTGYLGIAKDITEIKRAESEVKIAKERLELATRTGGIGIWDWNIVDNELAWDEQMFALYGVSPDHFSGAYEAWQLGLHPDDKEMAEAEVERALEGDKDFDTEFRVVLPDATVRHMRGLGKVLRDEKGSPIRMIGTNWDISRAVWQREEIVEYAEKANAANIAKSEFLANMSHEIRTPMNGVIGFCDLLLESELSEEQNTYAKYIASSARSLLEIINDILDISKIEAGKMDLELEPVHLKGLVDDCVHLLENEADKKGLRLEVSEGLDGDVYVGGDLIRIRQVLLNLVSNSLKFTKKGSVRVCMSVLKSEGMMKVSVEDTGIGIAPDKQKVLFQKFSQADGSTTRHYGGTGLGLAISKELVEIMGGEIGLVSESGQGAIFWFTLPIVDTPYVFSESEEVGEVVATNSTTLETQSLNILIVDDNIVNRMVLSKRLKQWGHRFHFAVDGKKAIDRVKSEEAFDIVFMDCEMPVMDGYEATRWIRKFESDSEGERRVPIIALTASAMTGDREKCIDAGMDEFLTKPIDLHALERVVKKWSKG